MAHGILDEQMRQRRMPARAVVGPVQALSIALDDWARMLRVTREDLVRFATRDWVAIDAEKAAFWIDRKSRMSPADVLSLGDDLRRHASVVRPDWPSTADRSADHATHERVTEALRAVTHVGAR